MISFAPTKKRELDNEHPMLEENFLEKTGRFGGFQYVKSSAKKKNVHGLPSLKLTNDTWKWMVGIRSFPFGAELGLFSGAKC